MLRVEQVKKTFGKVKALQGIDLNLQPKNSYAFIGPNGAGKTTLIKSILGLVIPEEGNIFVDEINTRNNYEYRKKIGYMPQIGKYPDNMTISQLIEMIKGIRHNVDKFDDDLIKAYKIQEIENKKMHTLSGGTRQKVSSVISFLFDPPILILDEPTAGLDPISVEILKDKINAEREKEKLVIITSHIMSDLDDLTSEIIYIFDGKIAFQENIETLKQITGQEKLGKAIAQKISSL